MRSFGLEVQFSWKEDTWSSQAHSRDTGHTCVRNVREQRGTREAFAMPLQAQSGATLPRLGGPSKPTKHAHDSFDVLQKSIESARRLMDTPLLFTRPIDAELDCREAIKITDFSRALARLDISMAPDVASACTAGDQQVHVPNGTRTGTCT